MKSKAKIKIGDVAFKKKKMVGWFSPGQLFDTAFRVVVSSVFSTYADKREALATSKVPPKHNYSHQEELWIDYIADIGDGWDPTYYSAYLLAKKELRVGNQNTRRGDLLIMGGDQVYPTSARQEYHNRLWGPYECAYPKSAGSATAESPDPAPHLFAIPGNHDWYDGLGNFLKYFCQQRTIGAWKTQQFRSYFAIQLNANCWLWGIDISLNSDIDKPQLDYFKDVGTQKMQDGDAVILCTAEPSWVSCHKKYDREKYEKLAFFRHAYIDHIACTAVTDEGQVVERVRSLNLVLVLAGDLHHYARYNHLVQGKQETYHFTAGGAGTFLHPTHNLTDSIDWKSKHSPHPEKFVLAKSFPSKKESKGLTFRNLVFPWFNPSFCAFMGALYLFFAWVLFSSDRSTLFASNSPVLGLAEAFPRFLAQLVYSPGAAFLVALLVVGMMQFADYKATNHKWLIVSLGILHGLLHAGLALVVLWVTWWFVSLPAAFAFFPTDFLNDLFAFVVKIAVMWAAGGYAGGLLMGLYLLVANLVFRVHDNEAFSAFHHPDYKSFLRMHITPEKITIYPIGIRQVPRAWVQQSSPSPSWFEPADPDHASHIHLIENPLEIHLRPKNPEPDYPLQKEHA